MKTLCSLGVISSLLTDEVGHCKTFARTSYDRRACSKHSGNEGGGFLKKTAFWGTEVLEEKRRTEFQGRRYGQDGNHQLVVSATSGQPKPPIFVLKKPERKPEIRHESTPSNSAALWEREDGLDKLPVDPNHRSGYAALIGKPNAGKSTLLNQIIG